MKTAATTGGNTTWRKKCGTAMLPTKSQRTEQCPGNGQKTEGGVEEARQRHPAVNNTLRPDSRCPFLYVVYVELRRKQPTKYENTGGKEWSSGEGGGGRRAHRGKSGTSSSAGCTVRLFNRVTNAESTTPGSSTAKSCALYDTSIKSLRHGQRSRAVQNTQNESRGPGTQHKLGTQCAHDYGGWMSDWGGGGGGI